jgi:peptidyl-tRNA hydrolase, PTH1 family
MHLIAGLGNPGSKYALTRHNTGFLVADELAKSIKAEFKPGKGDYWFAECSLNLFDITILKPSTQMNESGIPIMDFVHKNEIPIENILVVCDDFQIPLGTLRLRQNGTDGGHNGMASVIYHLQTDQVARLRCGIGAAETPRGPDMRDFVLEKFDQSEMPSVRTMVERARDACISFVVDGVNRTMNRYNIQPNENQ